MSIFRKLLQSRFDISHKDWVNFGLVVIISFMIVVYKIGKAGNL